MSHYSVEKCFEDLSKRHSTKVALIDHRQELSWSDWNLLADKLADALAARGCGPGVRVAVRMQSCIEWFIINVALAKLKAVQVLVNWRLTAQELAHVLEDSAASLLFLDDSYPALVASAWANTQLQVWSVNSEADAAPIKRWQPFDNLMKSGRAVTRWSEGRAPFILYTSGTTGAPRGVFRGNTTALDVSQDRKHRYLADSANDFHLTAEDIGLLVLPLHHGAGPRAAWKVLAQGGTLHMHRRFNPTEVCRAIHSHRVSHCEMVPTMLSRIRKIPLVERDAFNVSSVRALGVGAAPITPELKLATMDYFGDCLYENYGSSETGMAALLRPNEQRKKLMSCGRPYEGVNIRVTGEDGRALGAGEVGDIWIDTPIGIDRYLNHPALPLDKYCDGFFRTGDVGRIDDEGYLFLIDRSHDLIIAGGVNIYPAEIERVLKKHPAVLDVAVFGVPNEDFGEAVHAICEVGDTGKSLSIDELTNGVLVELAAYKRPRSIEFTSALPRNAMGKILKRVLREPFWRNHERNR